MLYPILINLLLKNISNLLYIIIFCSDYESTKEKEYCWVNRKQIGHLFIHYFYLDIMSLQEALKKVNNKNPEEEIYLNPSNEDIKEVTYIRSILSTDFTLSGSGDFFS